MNITIKIGTSKTLNRIVQEFLWSNGYTWPGGDKNYRDGYTDKKGMEIYANTDSKYLSYAWLDYEHYADKTVDARTNFGDLMALFETEPITIKLNEQYTAEISTDKKTVKVGCTTFDAEKIKEVAKALES